MAWFTATTFGGTSDQRDYPQQVIQDLSDVAVVIPALNEEESLPHVLRAMPPVGAILVVDNGCTDQTAHVAVALGAQVLSEPRRGYGNACKAGIMEAGNLGFPIVVILDADHSFDTSQMGRLVGPIKDGRADLVLGDRTRLAQKHALLPQQRFGNWVATRMIHLLTGHRYQDMGPFRACRTQALLDMRMEDPNFGWNVEMQIKAVQHCLQVMEVPVTCKPRVAGQSKISGSITGSLRCGAKMLWATWHHSR